MPSVVARGEFAAGFAVPSYMAFEDRLAGFDIKFVAPKTAWITPEPIAILAGARHPKAARAFIEFMLSERGQRVAMERGVFPITPKYRVQGAPGSRAEMAVEFTGGVRSYFDIDVTNIYDDDMAQKRYEQVNEQFRKDIESVAEELKKIAGASGRMHIAVQDLTKRFGPLAVVNGVSFTIEEGELFTLLGPSGCGKTTLLRLIAGFYTPDAGADPVRRSRGQRRAAASSAASAWCSRTTRCGRT